MKGMEELIFGIKAGYAFFYTESQEVNKTVQDIYQGLGQYFKENKNGTDYRVEFWDYEQVDNLGNSSYQDPGGLFDRLENMADGIDAIAPGLVLIAKNFNWFMVNEFGKIDKAKTAWLLNRSGKFSTPDFRKVLIIVGNEPFDNAIPEILRREFARVEFDLPDEKEIKGVYDFIVNSVKEKPGFEMPDPQTESRLIGAARGLSYSEIVKAYSYTLVKNGGKLLPRTVEEIRAAEVNATPGLTIGLYNKKLSDLIGYEIAKEIVQEWINDPDARGILLLGGAGTGKTHFAQSIAGEYNRPCIEFEFAGVQGGGLVGQAEAAMRRAWQVIAANANPAAPIIVVIDEIEKGLAGISGAGSSSGVRDGGTTERSTAQFLKFLSDQRPKGIYIIATCNDIEKLPAAYVRAERWDTAPIFVDQPNIYECDAILKHYQSVFDLTARPKDMRGWTGAEIKAWCKLARKKIEWGKNPNDADQLIIPVSKTMERELTYLRTWKEGKTVPASKRMVAPEAKPASRRVDF